MRSLVLLAMGALPLVVACSPPPPRPATAAPLAASPPSAAPRRPRGPPVPPTPPSRIAFASERSVCVIVLTPYELVERRCADLGHRVEELVWAGQWSLAARLESGAVFLVDVASGTPRATPLALPDESAFERPPPLGEDGAVQHGADPSTTSHLFAQGEEVWLARCPWWFGLDAGWCHEWVSARLHPPSADLDVSSGEPPGFRETPAPAFDASPPDDVSLRLVEGDATRPSELRCERRGTRSTFVPPETTTYTDIQWTWIPESASRYLATVEYDYGEAVFYRTFLLEACQQSASPLVVSGVQTGPDAYWILPADPGWIVRYGDVDLGRIDGELLTFPPPLAGDPP